jgi:tetratricopeptide (TPR) repeat protein/serine/threonine protein kinase
MPTAPDHAKTIFLNALEIPTAEARQEYLDRMCASDASLRAEVEELLHHNAQIPTAGDADAAVRTVDMPVEAPVGGKSGTVIGPYKLLQQIGEGGMGTVYMAEQTKPVQRKVALKVIKPGMDSRQVVARFEVERQALAMMDHPHIAKVLDAGTTGSGLPYFVMELVRGVPITKYCDEHHVTPRERLELFIPVCQAVQHAHQKGIIHRDLKPSNVLVAQYDGRPVPKVIDFGVAKATGQKLTERTMYTEFGAIVGTLEYMSPEQAESNQLDIDTRSDIYSLGVLLYELLTGTTPFEKKRLKDAALVEVLRMIREDEPQKPSTRLSTTDELPSISANRGLEPNKLSALVRGELDWIVMKALEKDRNRRYETANGFAQDVHRFLTDEPVLACPPSAGYRFRKFAQRNKGGLTVGALVLFFLVLLGSGIGWVVRDRSMREVAQTRQRGARQTKLAGEVESIFAEVDRLEKEQKWPEALEAARRAKAAVAAAEADPATAERVHQRLKDLEFVDRLEHVRMLQEAWVQGSFDNVGADREYARAFREYGVDVDDLPVETSIDRLMARPAFACVLAAALDNWVSSLRQVSEADVARWKRLVAVTRGIDPEPVRDRLRAALGQPVANVRDDLRRLAESVDIRAQQPTTLVLLALTLQRVQHPDSALRILLAGQYAHPGDFWLKSQLGALLGHQQDFEGAVRFFTAGVAIRPRSAVAHYNLGYALGEQGKLPEAIDACNKAIELDPKFAMAYSGLGNALRNQKKLPEAIDAYHKAIELDPKFAMAYSGLGNALSDQKKLPEAIDAYHKATDAYHKAIELNPKRAGAYNSLGALLCNELKDYEKATECFWKAIELDSMDARGHFNLGNALGYQNKLPEAVAAYRKAIELNPKYPRAHYNLGNVLRDQKKLNEAIAAYRKAIELDPKHADAHNNLGNAFLKNKGRVDEAIAEFKMAIELDPKLADAHINLGVALRNKGLADEAIDAYHKAIELDPKRADAHNNLAIAFLQNKGRVDEAIAEYRKAIELDPKYAHAHYNLGLALSDQKKWDEAIASYKNAIDVDPKYEPAYRSLRTALMGQGKLEEARAAWEQFLDSDPPDHEAWYGYGELCLFLGDEDAYRRNRTALLKRFGETTDPVVAERTARACLLLPASGEELEQAAALADRAVTLGKDHQYYAFFMATKALAEYRLGRFEIALDWGQKAGARGVWTPTHLVLAMAHHQLEHPEEARRSLDEAVKTYDWKSVEWRGIICPLRREAEDVLKIKKSP